MARCSGQVPPPNKNPGYAGGYSVPAIIKRCFFNIKTRAIVVLSGNINNTVSNDIISGDQVKSCLSRVELGQMLLISKYRDTIRYRYQTLKVSKYIVSTG